MVIDTGEHDDLTRQLARLALERVAPEELVLYDESSAEYFADPQAVLDPRRRQETVGFGLDLALLTPYVLAVSGTAVTLIGGWLTDAVSDEAKGVVGRWLRQLLNRDAAPPLTVEQAGMIRSTAYQQARALGLADQQAALIADSIAGAVLVR